MKYHVRATTSLSSIKRYCLLYTRRCQSNVRLLSSCVCALEFAVGFQWLGTTGSDGRLIKKGAFDILVSCVRSEKYMH